MVQPSVVAQSKIGSVFAKTILVDFGCTYVHSSLSRLCPDASGTDILGLRIWVHVLIIGVDRGYQLIMNTERALVSWWDNRSKPGTVEVSVLI
jgi:hypothetical protein